MSENSTASGPRGLLHDIQNTPAQGDSGSASLTSDVPRAGAEHWVASLLWVLPFLVLYWFNLYHHQLWRDELNAWGIAAWSPNLRALDAVIHYEGHPWLWYYILWAASRPSTAPVILKWVQGVVGTAAYLLIAFRSPFTRLEKTLIGMGYFVVFEYTVMSRMYGIILVCALLYAWRRAERPNDPMSIAAILAVMASTDMSGIMLSGCLLFSYLYQSWDTPAGGEGHVSRKRAFLALSIYAGALAIAVFSMIPARDIGLMDNRMFAYATQPGHIVRSVADVVAAPFWPISRDFPHRFWDRDTKADIWLIAMTPLIALAYWRIFRRDRNALLTIALTICCAAAFSDLIYLGHARNWGITLLAFLVALWLLRDRTNKSSTSGVHKPLPMSAYGLLSASALAGVIAIGSSWVRPFSHSRDVAEWIRANHLADAPLVGAWDFTVAGVAEQLQRPMYFLECGCTANYKLFARGRSIFYDNEFPSRLAKAEDDLHTHEFIYIGSQPLRLNDLASFPVRPLHATQLVSFTGAEAWMEDYYVYRVTDAGDR